ncbi:hypothetical protein CCMA1212_001564 [Trichoderma ghanense]|uniref:Uncharacterized protein n=1 Tax=Trichoderma ghanense TaxID=65468 RepID=A0ABY2HDC3_9HYPO
MEETEAKTGAEHAGAWHDEASCCRDPARQRVSWTEPRKGHFALNFETGAAYLPEAARIGNTAFCAAFVEGHGGFGDGDGDGDGDKERANMRLVKSCRDSERPTLGGSMAGDAYEHQIDMLSSTDVHGMKHVQSKRVACVVVVSAYS